MLNRGFLLAGLFIIDFRSVLALCLLAPYADIEFSVRMADDNLYFSN